MIEEYLTSIVVQIPAQRRKPDLAFANAIIVEIGLFQQTLQDIGIRCKRSSRGKAFDSRDAFGNAKPLQALADDLLGIEKARGVEYADMLTSHGLGNVSGNPVRFWLRR